MFNLKLKYSFVAFERYWEVVVAMECVAQKDFFNFVAIILPLELRQ